jgi:hypothetical protein
MVISIKHMAISIKHIVISIEHVAISIEHIVISIETMKDVVVSCLNVGYVLFFILWKACYRINSSGWPWGRHETDVYFIQV